MLMVSEFLNGGSLHDFAEHQRKLAKLRGVATVADEVQVGPPPDCSCPLSTVFTALSTPPPPLSRSRRALWHI